MHSKSCSVAILAGGKGTRLLERCGDLPKPMVSLLGKPVLQYQIDLCRRHDFCNIALLVQHRYEKIVEYFGDGTNFGVSLKYAIESEPRGTAGALRDALPLLSDRFLVLYGDTFIDVDLRKMWKVHLSSSAVGTLALHPNDHPHDSDLVDIDCQGMIRQILPYPHPPGRVARNLVNAAVYILERAGLEDVTPSEGKADIAKHMFPLILASGRRLYGYVTPEYIKDMGTPERLDKVEQDYVAGVPERLSSRHSRSAVFLDRDGTLIKEVNHLIASSQVELLPGAATAVQRLNRSGRLTVVVTNQPVIARGDLSFEGLAQVHNTLDSQLGVHGAFVDRFYFCPHHPEKGFRGEVPELKVACLCRKPEPGLIDEACRELGIDRFKSWMVGDTTSDIEAGRRAGVRTILVRTGYSGSDAKHMVRPDYVCLDLSDAVDWILRGHPRMMRSLAPSAATVSDGKRLVLIGGLARTGKSFAAQVLKESLNVFGREAHIISVDAWLKRKDERLEGAGVFKRYDLDAAIATLETLVHSRKREVFRELLYDRINRIVGPSFIEHSIGPSDIIIVEGVPALLMKSLVSLKATLKIFIKESSTIRTDRLRRDYALRGYSAEDCARIFAMRELDEIPVVNESLQIADLVIETSARDLNT